MYNINGRSIIRILKNSLSYIDSRLINHGERVAYLIYCMKKSEGKCTSFELYEYCMTAALHDIGAYKIEEIDNIFSYEAKNYEDHCYHGYLYLKYFTILSHRADAILYHHEPFDLIDSSECDNKDMAKIISFADRIDIFLTLNKGKDLSLFRKLYAGTYPDYYFDLLEKAERENEIIGHLLNNTYSMVIEDFFSKIKTKDDKYFVWLKSFAFLIDFRSSVTLAHTMTTEVISAGIATHMNLSEEDVKKVALGAFLHDIGKISTPHNILEKEGSLNAQEMMIMQNHVVITRNIIEGNIDEDIVNIASRHHEKLDGTGYPDGLTDKSLTQLEKIVAVADITSALAIQRSYKEAFSEEKIISILSEMAQEGKICKKATQVLIDNSSEIFADINEVYEQFKYYYNLLISEFNDLRSRKLINKNRITV